MKRGVCEWSNEELATQDLLCLNLIGARDLPCAQPWDFYECRRIVSKWVDVVRVGIENCFRRYRRQEEYRDLSDSKFRMLTLYTILSRNLGVWYNVAYMDDPYDARDSCNAFVHGILSGRGGSCVSMPVLVATIGRRLGYPIRLVHAKCHGFCRWEDPSTGERFNIDGSGGFTSQPDSHYMKWPYRIEPEEVYTYRSYLQNLTPREEFSSFLYERGMCWFHHLEIEKAVEAFYWAHELHPNHPPRHQMWSVTLIVHRVFGPRPKDYDAIDSEEITRNMDALKKFPGWAIRLAQREFESVLNNWRTRRPPFSEPRLNIPSEFPKYCNDTVPD